MLFDKAPAAKRAPTSADPAPEPVVLD